MISKSRYHYLEVGDTDEDAQDSKNDPKKQKLLVAQRWWRHTPQFQHLGDRGKQIFVSSRPSLSTEQIPRQDFTEKPYL